VQKRSAGKSSTTHQDTAEERFGHPNDHRQPQPPPADSVGPIAGTLKRLDAFIQHRPSFLLPSTKQSNAKVAIKTLLPRINARQLVTEAKITKSG
jgi:hypothetical protein